MNKDDQKLYTARRDTIIIQEEQGVLNVIIIYKLNETLFSVSLLIHLHIPIKHS